VADAPPLYAWLDDEQPILALHTTLGSEPDDLIAVSWLDAEQEWHTTNIALRFADSFARSVSTQNQVYIPVNEQAGLKPGPPEDKRRGDETTVTRVKALWADLDFKAGGVGSAEQAKSVIDTLAGILNAAPTAIVFSGGGFQPYWELEDAVLESKEDRAKWSGILRSWGTLVKTVAAMDGGKADSVFDLPRVLRAPGTLNLKGTPTQTRLHLVPGATPIDERVILEALETYGIPLNTEAESAEVLSPPAEWEPAAHDCEWSPAILDKITAATPDARHPWLIDMMVTLYAAMRNGCITQDSFDQLMHTLRVKFEYLLQQGEKRTLAPREITAAAAWARHRVSTLDAAGLAGNLNFHTHMGEGLRLVGDLGKGQSSDAPTSSDASGTAIVGNLALLPASENAPPITAAAVAETLSHVGNARRLIELVDGHYVHVPNVGWHKWDGARWALDETRSIESQEILAVAQFVNRAPNDRVQKWANQSFMQGNIELSVKAASAMVSRPMHKFDENPYELCTPKGIVDLKTGTFRNPDRHVDFNTKQTTIAPAIMPTPHWFRFLEQIIVDRERIDFLQEIFGLALIGEVLEHILPLFVGGGQNGKSTMLEILSGILGDYAITLNEGFLTKQKHKEHSSEVAQLHGVRFAFYAESDPDAVFNEARVKELTGGDSIRARFMGKDFITIRPSWTIMGAMNHLPKVSAGGDSFFRRARKVDFNVQIPEEQRDPLLKQRLLDEEGPGILQWMIEGARRYLDRGKLTEPESVKVATAEYRRDEDQIARFLDERARESEHSNLSGREIFQNYAGWANSQGEKPIPKTQLLRELEKRVTAFRRGSGTDRYDGLVLFED
jgi:P4 family phage/plasmid primase-like protien